MPAIRRCLHETLHHQLVLFLRYRHIVDSSLVVLRLILVLLSRTPVKHFIATVQTSGGCYRGDGIART